MARYQEIALRSGETIRLTERELLFCNYYLGECNRNGTQAAIKAGFSERSARTYAAQTLAKSNIQKYIHDQTAPVLDAMGADKDRLLKEWVKIGLSDITDYLDEDWSIKNLSEIKKNATGAIESVQVDEKVLIGEDEEPVKVLQKTVKFKLHNKIKALTTLSEMQGLIKPREAENTQQAAGQNLNLFQQVNNYYNSK